MNLQPSSHARLLTQLDALDYFLDKTTPESLKQRPKPDKWSVHENLAHLGRYHEVFSERIHQILNQKIPQFERYKSENDPQFSTWVDLPTPKILSKTNELRNKLIEWLSNLSTEQLKKTGIHPALGEMDLHGWIEFFLLHENHHLYTIFWIIRQRAS